MASIPFEMGTSMPSGKFSRRQKYATTLGIFLGNICLAFAENSYSPVIVDFANKYETEVGNVSVIFAILSISSMAGALLTSFIFKFLNRQLAVVITTAGMGACLYLTPLCPALWSLCAVSAFLGLFYGVFNAAINVWVVEMWRGESGVYVQGAHFTYSVGALLLPLLFTPFLSQEKEEDKDGSTTGIPLKNEQMWIPFTIVGTFITITGLYHVYLFAFQRYVPTPSSKIIEVKVENVEAEDPPQPRERMNSKYLQLILISLSALFRGLNSGSTRVSSQFISTFAQFGELDFTGAQGAQVITFFRGTFAVGRGLGMLASLKVSAEFILVVNLILLFLANILLLVIRNSAVGLWVGVGLLGLGFSTVNASFCTYLDEFMGYTNAIGSLMIVSSSIVGAIYPIVIGQDIEENPVVLTFVNIFSTGVMTLAILIIFVIVYLRSK